MDMMMWTRVALRGGGCGLSKKHEETREISCFVHDMHTCTCMYTHMHSRDSTHTHTALLLRTSIVSVPGNTSVSMISNACDGVMMYVSVYCVYCVMVYIGTQYIYPGCIYYMYIVSCIHVCTTPHHTPTHPHTPTHTPWQMLWRIHQQFQKVLDHHATVPLRLPTTHPQM